MEDRPRVVRIAAGLWVALAVVIWNVLFDYEIDAAVKRYLFQQRLHLSGRGPAVGVSEIMRPAAVSGAVRATVAAMVVAAVGFAAIGLAVRAEKIA